MREIRVGDRPVPRTEVAAALRSVPSCPIEHARLIIAGSRDAEYGLIMSVMDAAREVGLEKISFRTVRAP